MTEDGVDDTFCSIIEEEAVQVQCTKYSLRKRNYKLSYSSENQVKRLRKINRQIKKHKMQIIILQPDQLRKFLAELKAATLKNIGLGKSFEKLINSNIQYIDTTINCLGKNSLKSETLLTSKKLKSTQKSQDISHIEKDDENISPILLQTIKNEDSPMVHSKEEERCDIAGNIGIFKTNLLDMKKVEEFLNSLCEQDNFVDDVTRMQHPQTTPNGVDGKELFNGRTQVAESSNSFKNSDINFKAVRNGVSNDKRHLWKYEQNLIQTPKIIVDSINEVQSINRNTQKNGAIKINQFNPKSFPAEPDFDELFRDFQQILETANVEFFSQNAECSEVFRTQTNSTNLHKEFHHSTPIPQLAKLADHVEYPLTKEDVEKVASKLNIDADKLKQAIESVLGDDAEDSVILPSQSPPERRYASSQIPDENSILDFLNIQL